MTRETDHDSPSPRLLAVTIDWLPAWMLPAYGATWVAAPSLDTFAAAGVVFDRVLTTSVCVAETRRMLVPFADRLESAGRLARAADLDAAAELVRRGRHHVVVCHLDSLGRSWDAPAELRERYRDPEDPPAMEGSEPPCFSIDENDDPDRLTVVRQAFAAEVTAIDQRIGRLLDAVADSPSPWHVCVAGTGGMPLGLHGQVGIPSDNVPSGTACVVPSDTACVVPSDTACVVPYGERVHLPVILREAGGRMAGQRYPRLVSAADIGATLGEWIGLPPSAGAATGSSLAGLFDSWTAPSRERLFIRGRAAAAVATPEWHLVVTWPQSSAAWPQGKGPEVKASLFTKPDDWFEVTDVADRCPAEADALLQECLAASDVQG